MKGTGLAVVVVHWNSPADCAKTVDQLRASSVPVRITVVDNASDPTNRATLADLLADLAEVEVLDCPTNLGFGPGANIGLERFLADHDGGEWVALVPHDVQVAPRRSSRCLPLHGRSPMRACVALMSAMPWCR